ncbi:Eaa1 [Klebsiella pneumoniae]|uniref:DUF551 domain-containing protein n=3 Tax=Klebsiella pneumoniae TaxID=573 RepID=UPI000E2E2DCE|nr:DUF551 domain-containing protein [Klebsiella pneumoniae]SWB09654.1 Eaa1 [Klebsiella pneumoniae]
MSEFSRETLLNIIETDHVQCGDASALARMALAVMDSESWCLPLDYLQGHKDGLEWAAQLAEANHPETGDWLYDDPIELAKAIRKGPDMPPAQPVADSEPDRNPVLAYADSYRDMAKQGVESVPIWSVITDLERNIAPLYSHAQPVPVTEREPIAWLNDAYLARGVVDGEAGSEDAGPGYIPVYREAQPAPVVPEDFDFNRFNDVVWLECVASNPHMHSPTTSAIARVALELNKRSATMEAEPVAYTDEEELNFVNDMACMWTKGMGINEVPLYRHPQPAPVVPDDVLEALQNVAADFLTVLDEYPEQLVPINRDSAVVRALRAAMLAAAPHDTPALNSVQSVVTVPGKWIPVSERMPEVGDIVLTAMGGVVNVGEMECSAANCRFFTSVISGRELPATHWLPLPAGPKEDINALIPLVSRNEQEGK